MPWVISGNGLPVPDLKYLSTAEEAEMRIWRHATLTSAQHILLTETYNIGLPIVQEWYSSIQCILQLNVPLSLVLKYLHINNLIQALEDDQDLVTQRQTTHHYSDALYVSYFSGLGKAALVITFCQHAPFVTGTQLPGIRAENTKEDFLSSLHSETVL